LFTIHPAYRTHDPSLTQPIEYLAISGYFATITAIQQRII